MLELSVVLSSLALLAVFHRATIQWHTQPGRRGQRRHMNRSFQGRGRQSLVLACEMMSSRGRSLMAAIGVGCPLQAVNSCIATADARARVSDLLPLPARTSARWPADLMGPVRIRLRRPLFFRGLIAWLLSRPGRVESRCCLARIAMAIWSDRRTRRTAQTPLRRQPDIAGYCWVQTHNGWLCRKRYGSLTSVGAV